MPQFLFVVDIPPTEEGISPSVTMNVNSQWHKFERQSESIKLPGGNSRKICRNTWLLDAKNSLPALVQLTNFAMDSQLQTTSFLVTGEVTEISSGIKQIKP